MCCKPATLEAMRRVSATRASTAAEHLSLAAHDRASAHAPGRIEGSCIARRPHSPAQTRQRPRRLPSRRRAPHGYATRPLPSDLPDAPRSHRDDTHATTATASARSMARTTRFTRQGLSPRTCRMLRARVAMCCKPATLEAMHRVREQGGSHPEPPVGTRSVLDVGRGLVPRLARSRHAMSPLCRQIRLQRSGRAVRRTPGRGTSPRPTSLMEAPNKIAPASVDEMGASALTSRCAASPQRSRPCAE
jgi:hypothetical protein